MNNLICFGIAIFAALLMLKTASGSGSDSGNGYCVEYGKKYRGEATEAGSYLHWSLCAAACNTQKG